ncbi:MAG: DUF1176 domain-containing protein [Caulobacteraceae bacterium]|nr:DUF1176 domain-containing protein [Caulobacteraceae bacterium]
MIAIAIDGAAAAAEIPAAQVPLAEVRGAAPVYREIKDWVLACDNTRVCFARYDPAADGAGGGYLSIAREPGPAGGLTLSLEVVDGDGAPSPASLRLDGRPIGALPWTLDPAAQTATLQGPAAAGLVRALKDGSRLAYSPARGAPFVSLAGMKAALLAMDEDQGRLDGETALIRTGPRPASAVPAGPPLPVVRASPTPDNLPDAAAFAAAVRRARADVLRQHECEPEAASNDEAHALGPGEALVMLGCINAAYQGSVVALRAPRNAPAKARVLVLPLPPTADPANITPDVVGEYVGADWDEKTASFSESSKGRGLADCGSSSTWTFDGKAFQLTQYNALTRCGGGPPGDWPTIYRAWVAAK